ncbi:MAG: hypothetical protein EOM55_05060 [Clostridia bacterium]|nr:hypothetical protein [Clostridia bacterium]
MIDENEKKPIYGSQENEDHGISNNDGFIKQKNNSLLLLTDKVYELFKKLKKLTTPSDQKNSEHETDALDELSTLDQKVSDIRKKTVKRIVGVMLFFSVGLFIMLVLFKWGLLMWREAKRPVVETKVQELTLEVNPLNKWQEIKDQQITQLGDDIKKIETNVDKKLNEVQSTISSELNDTKASVNQSMLVLQDANKQAITDVLSEIKSEIKSMNEDAKQYTDQKNLTISEKIAQIESKKRDFCDK